MAGCAKCLLLPGSLNEAAVAKCIKQEMWKHIKPETQQLPASMETDGVAPVADNMEIRYEHKICEYEGETYHVWWNKSCKPTHAVVYLPATGEAGSGIPLDMGKFTGREIVFSPIVYNTSKCPWKNEVPEWIEGWILTMMQRLNTDAKWSLVGFSRGAAWGLKLSSRIEEFKLVLLVAPYLLPRWSDEEKAQIENRLSQMHRNKIMLVI